MKDRVGNNNPSKETTDSIAEHIAAALGAGSQFLVRLTPDERRGATKFRHDGERIVELLAKLATKYNFSLPGLSVAGMLNDMNLAKQVRPLAAEAASLAETLGDTELQAESECWWVATAYYTALLRIADSNSDLASDLRPIVDFFATGRRKKAGQDEQTE